MCWLLLILYIYFNLINEGLCFVNYTVHSLRKSYPLNVHDKQFDPGGFRHRNAVLSKNLDVYNSRNGINKNSGTSKTSKMNGLGRSIRINKRNKVKHPKKEDLEELFSKDNDEHRLIKQKEASIRYFSEINNRLLNKIAHNNQKKSSSKIKILAKRAERRSDKYVRELERKVLEKENKKKEMIEKIKKKKDKEKEEYNNKEKENKEEKDIDNKNYKRSKITDKELGLLPLKVPGIRALDKGFSDKVSVEEFDLLIKLGFDGIIDMNSLFINKNEEKDNKLDKMNEDNTQNKENVEYENRQRKTKQEINKNRENIDKEERDIYNKTEKIDIEEDISDSEFVNVSFNSLGIYDKNIIKTLKVKGVKKPTYTQKRYIPEITNMMIPEMNLIDKEYENYKSNIIHASTGSGKTLTYMLPIFQSCFNQSIPLFSQGTNYDFESMLMYFRDLVNQDILVICPSLELCVQSCRVAKDIYEGYEYIYSENEEKEQHRDNKEDKDKKSKDNQDKGRLRIKTEIRPTLLIGNANVIYQKKNIKKINNEKEEDYRIGKEVIDGIKNMKLFTREAVETADTIKRTVGMYFATPGRLHSILFKHKLLDINSFKYIVMDEYDSYLDDYKKLKGIENMNKERDKENIEDIGYENSRRNRGKDIEHEIKEMNRVDKISKDKIRNKQTKELLQKIFNQITNRCGYMKKDDIPKEFLLNFLNLGRKYVMCVSASDNIDIMPESLKKQILKNKNNKEGKDKEKENKRLEKIKEDIENEEEIDKSSNKYKTTYKFPKNILHTMAIYSVPDAKLSLLRKILKSVPYNKSVLIFCDSNGTANFLFKYLSNIFKDCSIELLNSVQNRISRRKAFSNIIQTNINNTNLYNRNKKTTRLVKDILISTRLNSRGIDFSGYTHVINYDLPHDSDSYIHKSGRIGRAGNPGICISLVEAKYLPAFKRAIVNHLPLQFHTIDSNNSLLVTKS